MRLHTAPAGLALALFAFLAGCGDRKPVPAVGGASEVNILAPRERRQLADSVASVLREGITYIRSEPRFDVTVDALENFKFYKSRKSVFVVGPEDDADVRKVLRSIVTPRVATPWPDLWRTVDPFAEGQVLFLLTGEPRRILTNLEQDPGGLVRQVETAAVDILVANLFRNDERVRAGAEMETRYGWSVRVPSAWVVEDRSTDASTFVRIWHDGPVMQMFVSWEQGDVARTPREWLERRHALGFVHYDGDEVVWERSRADSIEHTPSGPPGVMLGGLWENDRYVIGGPFEAWAFHCPADDRTYLLDLSVYAPDREKLPLLRTLRAVARTFRDGCAPGRPAAAAPAAAEGS